MEWFEELKEDDIEIEDLDERYKNIVEQIGIKNFIKLIKETGGINFYVPKIDTFLKGVRNKKIGQDYNGYNLKELSKKYNLTQRQIRNILKESEPDGQLSLFEIY